MSQKKKHETKVINIRDLTPDDKGRIKELLKYGDAAKIARRCSVGYVQVLNVLNPKHKTDNYEVWQEAINYLSDLPSVEVDDRIADIIKGKGENESK